MNTATDLTPRAFSGCLANLDFTIGLPRGFVVREIPPEAANEQPDFSDPTKVHALGIAMSEVAMAVLTVAARPAYEDGSVYEWIRYLATEQGLTLTTLMPGRVGPHPAILLDAEQVQDGTALRFRVAALEDGGRFVVVMGMAPAELWPSYGASLAAGVESFTLQSPQGGTSPLVPNA